MLSAFLYQNSAIQHLRLNWFIELKVVIQKQERDPKKICLKNSLKKLKFSGKLMKNWQNINSITLASLLYYHGCLASDINLKFGSFNSCEPPFCLIREILNYLTIKNVFDKVNMYSLVILKTVVNLKMSSFYEFGKRVMYKVLRNSFFFDQRHYVTFLPEIIFILFVMKYFGKVQHLMVSNKIYYFPKYIQVGVIFGYAIILILELQSAGQR